MKLRELSNKELYLSPSVLAADFANLASEVKKASEEGAELLHLDVMDGHLVPNISIGIPVIQSLRPHSERLFDAHLMISNPKKYAEAFAKAGTEHITFHVECEDDIQETIDHIHELGMTAGLTLKPGTSIDTILPYLEQIEMVLIMTVEPGFGGQSFMEDQVEKIRVARQEIDRLGLNVHIQVDGGVSAKTAPTVIEAGANILVAGTAFFRHPEGMKKASEELRQG